ncbi:hypothetical protein BKA93DRAFT_478715 [Sparassis latifolia]
MHAAVPHPRKQTSRPSHPAAKTIMFRAYQPGEPKSRRHTTKREKRRLEAVYDQNPTPHSTILTTLAKELNMEIHTVRIWFQNRRAKTKRQQRLMESKCCTPVPSPQDTDNPSYPETPDGKLFWDSDTLEQPNSISPAYLTYSSEQQPSTTSTSSPVDSPSNPIFGPSRITTLAYPLTSSPSHSTPMHISYSEAHRRPSLPNFHSSVPVSDYYASPPRSTDAASTSYSHYPRSTYGYDHGNMHSFACTELRTFNQARRLSADLLMFTHMERRSGSPNAEMVMRRNTELDGDDGAQFARHCSFDDGGVTEPPYTLSIREVYAPPPGPLPAPDFSFGAPYAGEQPPLPAFAPQPLILPYALESGKDESHEEYEYYAYKYGVRHPPAAGYPYEFAHPSGSAARFGSIASVAEMRQPMSWSASLTLPLTPPTPIMPSLTLPYRLSLEAVSFI